MIVLYTLFLYINIYIYIYIDAEVSEEVCIIHTSFNFKVNVITCWKALSSATYILRKMYRNICERKPKHFTLRSYNQIVAHEHETRTKVNNKLVLPRYTKSTCQKAWYFAV